MVLNALYTSICFLLYTELNLLLYTGIKCTRIPEGRNKAVVVEGLERLAHCENHALVGVEEVRLDFVEGVSAEGALALLDIRERVVNADDKRAALNARLPDRLSHLRH